MKNFTSVASLCVILFAIVSLSSSCKKEDTSQSRPPEVLVVGQWSLNRVQLKLYNGNTFLKDTIIAFKSYPNYLKVDTNVPFEYKMNSTTANTGTYVFVKATAGDSLIATTPSKLFNWKILTLTTDLLTTVETSTSDPAFPGKKVETYHTFVR